MQNQMLCRMGIALVMLWSGPQAWPQRAVPPATPQAQPAPAPAARSASRRDPFKIIVVKKGEETPLCTAPGMRGLLIGQLHVQGIVSGIKGEWIAMVSNNTKRAYFLREKDELCNGVVARIAPGSVVFTERFKEVSGREQTREVIKQLSGQASSRTRRR